MKRRELIILLGGAVLGWPRAARTQQSAVPRVGYVWAGARGTDGSAAAGLRRGLADVGYVVGRNLALEERYANGNPERVASLIDELLALNVNVLVTPGTPITLAAHRATSTVPIVCVTGDPVRTGFAESLAQPGGNITGLSLLSGDYSVKWLELLRESAPPLRPLAMPLNPDNPGTVNQSKLIREAAPGLGFELTPLSIRPVDVQHSLSPLLTARFAGFVLT